MITLKYRGYIGTIENSKKDNCLFGKVINIPKVSITYEGQCLNDLIKDFSIAIDDYVLECENSGVEPEELTVKPNEFKNCSNCGKEMNMAKNEYITIMHHGMHHYVCSEKCMLEYYK